MSGRSQEGVAMVFRLDVAKAIQAAAVLLRLESGNRMNYMRLLKLLYIADRESLKETARPITGDRVVAMDRGTVLSGVFDLIKGQHIDARHWDEFIETARFDVQLRGDPGNGKLSRYEIAKLQEISRRYESDDEWAMVDITHQFEEWRRNKPQEKSSRPIPLEDILDAVGRSADKHAIIQDASDAAAFDRFFSGRSS
ncbi:MAG: SocA family protein [Planctomycetes bacterium]|nr:SocA family protein [Planctomycetota bacterium]